MGRADGATKFYQSFSGCYQKVNGILGLPMALNFSITAVGTMILQSAVNAFGSSVVASFTAAMKVEQLSTQPLAF